MRKMSKYRIINKGIVRIEITAVRPDNFVNLLWKNNIKICTLRKENICTYIMDISTKDYRYIKSIAEKNNVNIRILKKYGFTFLKGKYKNRKAFVFGVLIFVVVIYFFSSFIWSIDIDTEFNISPYEIRKQLEDLGIKPGIYKKNINVIDIEDKLLRDNSEIVWAKTRIEGTRFHVQISERQTPPNLIKDDTPCDLAANKDGEISRVYTNAGTAIVEEGDMVRKDEILVKGQQGKVGEEYDVHAEGKIFAKTYYERKKVIDYNNIQRIRTGKKAEKIYFTIMGKKVFLKNELNNFENCDKIEYKNSFIKKTIYYEVEKKKKRIKNMKELIKDITNELYSDIMLNFDRTVKVLDKVEDVDIKEDCCQVRVVIIAEENIAIPRIISNDSMNE